MKTLQGTLTENSLKTISEFLRRVDLKGSEVPAFNQLITELQTFAPKKETKLDTETKL